MTDDEDRLASVEEDVRTIGIALGDAAWLFRCVRAADELAEAARWYAENPDAEPVTLAAALAAYEEARR